MYLLNLKGKYSKSLVNSADAMLFLNFVQWNLNFSSSISYYRLSQRRQDIKKSYGVFLEIYLVENQECDRDYSAIDNCAFYEQFSQLIFNQKVDAFSFASPICQTDSYCV